MSNTSDITGYWYTDGREGGVEIYECDEKICGRLYWLGDEPGQLSERDVHNIDPEKRRTPLCRMQFMGGFNRHGNGRYTDGWIYNPRNGQSFNAEMTVVDRTTLNLHGYILTPILGESQIWKRAERMPACTEG